MAGAEKSASTGAEAKGSSSSGGGLGGAMAMFKNFQTAQKLQEALYKAENGQLVALLEKAEKATGQPREFIVAGVGALLGVYLVIGFFAELLCNFMGFAYPAYASFKAIRSVAKDDDTEWLIYWTVFAVFSLVDFAAEVIYSWFPFYWVFKAAFLCWLWCPATRGAQTLYKEHLGPAFDRHAPAIADLLARVGLA